MGARRLQVGYPPVSVRMAALIGIRRLVLRLDLGHLDAHFDKCRKNGKPVRESDTGQSGQYPGIDCVGSRKWLRRKWLQGRCHRRGHGRTIVPPSGSERNPADRRCWWCHCRCVDGCLMTRIVRLTNPVANTRKQFLIGSIEQLGQMAQAFMRPPDRGALGKQVGTEGNRFFGNALGQELAAKRDRALVGWKGFHVPGNSGASREKISCRLESEPIGHDRHAFIEKPWPLKPHAGRWSSLNPVPPQHPLARSCPPAFIDRQLP